MLTKQLLYTFCKNFIEGRLARIHRNIQGVQEALASETKSSAGDKHETGRAMLQLEREKLGKQLAEAENIAQVLVKVPLKEASKTIVLGSWVRTVKNSYYLAISAGEYTGIGDRVYCISLGTPIGMLLKGKSKGDILHFNGEEIKILEVR